MKRAVLAVVAVLLLAACNNGSGGAAADGPVELIVQAAGGESEIKAIEDMAAAFEQTRKDVKVSVVGVAEQGDHMARLSTAFAAGDPPDVFLLNYRRFGQFAARGVIDRPDPLSPADYYLQPLNAFTFEGTLLCRPQNVSSTVTYFNPDLFAKAGVPMPAKGWRWDDMRSAAERLRAAGVEAIGFEHSLRTVAPFVWSARGQVTDHPAKPTVVTLGTPEGRKALAYLKNLLRFGVSAEEEAADPAEERFARGELAMFLDSRRAVPKFRKSKGLKFDVAPLPLDMDQRTLLAADAYCVSKAGRHRDLAHALATFAVGPDGGRILAASGRTVPSHKGLAQSDAFLAPGQMPPNAHVWLDAVDTVVALPNVGPWNETESNVSELLEQFFADKLSLDDTVRRVTDESKRLLAQ